MRSRYSLAASISIHALRGEGDATNLGLKNDRAGISIHALRGEGDITVNF